MELDRFIKEDVLRALENDHEFNFKRSPEGKYFRYGLCNVCKRKSLYISQDDPRRIACSHAGCTFDETVFQRYKDIFENIGDKFPATPEDPHATAKAYMKNSRGFPSSVNSWFVQGHRPIGNNKLAPTVRFPLWDGAYWERLINAKDIREMAKRGRSRKAHFSEGIQYQGKCWVPPGLTIEEGDTVYIVEGIFHAIALMLIGIKAIAAFSCVNLPRDFIEQHSEKNITWILAYDNDFNNAGNEYCLKYKRELKKKGYKVEVSQCPKGKDWDDVYKANELTEEFLDNCLHRGRVFASESLKERAYWIYVKSSFTYKIIDFGQRLYSVSVDKEFTEQIAVATGSEQSDLFKKDFVDAILTEEGKNLFEQNCSANSISNCHPKFIYSQVDKSSGEVAYHFNVDFPKSRPMQIAFSGSALESPASFNKALLNQAPGATFDGSANQLKRIRDQWFDNGVMIVDTVSFIGYDKDSKIYVFPKFGFSEGRYLKLSRFDYLQSGKTRIKSTLSSVDIVESRNFDPSIIENYYTAFSHNGLVVLAFYLGSLFAEQIRKHLGFFPFLEFTGQAGAGKTSALMFCWKLLGRVDYEGINPSKATFAARSRAFTQAANLPLVLIEGDSRDGKDSKKGGFDFTELKDLFNGRGVRATGAFNRGNDIIEPPFRGSVIIAQNNTIDADEAVLTRIVHCHATTAHQRRENKKIADWFGRVPVEEVSGFLFNALQNEKKITESILDSYLEMDSVFNGIEKIKHQRIVQCHALVAAMVKALPIIFPGMRSELVDQTIELLKTRAVKRQERLNEDHPTVAAFWEIFDLLNIKTEEVQGGPHENFTKQYEQLNHSKSDELIAVNLQEFNQKVESARMERIDLKELKKLLPGSQRHKFIAHKTVKSNIVDGSSRWCAVFKKNPNFWNVEGEG